MVSTLRALRKALQKCPPDVGCYYQWIYGKKMCINCGAT